MDPEENILEPEEKPKAQPNNSIASLLARFLPRNEQTYHKAQTYRISKHRGRHFDWKKRDPEFKCTKCYADDRQKAPHNRRKYGMRKRK